MPKQNWRRKRDYQRLKEAGFTSKEANKHRSKKEETIQELINQKQDEGLSTSTAAAGKRDKYRKLREAGYSAAEARKYRERSEDSVDRLIERKTKKPGQRTYGWQRKFTKPKHEVKGKLNQNMIEVKEGETYLYNRRYNYPIWYVTKDKDGVYEEKYLIFTSDKEMTKAELKKAINEEIFSPNEGKYSAKVIQTSITFLPPYFNKNAAGE